jgi:catechol 2,3-dioxygenase-like lactoylglutathione lyase family enzyme
MTVKRMDNIGIVVEDIDTAIEFFTELGLELEGRAPIEGSRLPDEHMRAASESSR